MAPPAISVVVVNYNGEDFLSDCLNALRSQTFTDFEVIVVDNGSTDGSPDLLRDRFQWVRVIRLAENTGFARGNNIGFASSAAKYVATLNNDTIVSGGWLQALHEAAEADSNIGMAASKIYLGREGSELDSAGMLIYPDGMSRQRGHGQIDPEVEGTGRFDRPEEVLFPSACAALYRRAMLDDVGFFDEDFFSYCEDSDLGLRARLAGWKAVFAPRAVVRHLYSGTGGRYSEFKAFHIERNHFMVLLKDMPPSYIIMFPFYAAWRYTVQLFGLLTGKGSAARFAEGHGKSGLISVIFRAWWAVLAGLPGILGKRQKIWSRRRITRKAYADLLKRHRISASEMALSD